jgi:hypothetical protein
VNLTPLPEGIGAIAVPNLGFVLRTALTFGVARLPLMRHVGALRAEP